MPEKLSVQISEGQTVTALIYPSAARERVGVTLLLGHGAGADQTSGFMVSFAEAFAARGIDAATFNFLYTEQGRRAPDRNDKLEQCYRAVIDAVRAHPKLQGNSLVIGGKSMGGRIASQVAAKGVEGLAGLVFFGYPLHPPGKPDQLRAEHLSRINAPMLFVQGSRDAFGTPEELRPVIEQLGGAATLRVIGGGDHSFKVPKSSGLSPEDVFSGIQDTVSSWLRHTALERSAS